MPKAKKYHIIIAGGGTGGHVFPAIAIADELSKVMSNIEILFVGSLGKLEMEKVPDAGYKIIGLPIKGFERKISFQNFKTIFLLFWSLLKSVKIILQFKPDLAIGVGGYASGPVLFICTLLRKPILLQEQNSYPGITNKILSKGADKICVAYHHMDRFFDKSKIVLTGNPVRANIQLSEVKETSGKNVLVVGGSLGARTINDSILTGLETLTKESVNLKWQTGKLYYNEINNVLKNKPLNVEILPFINDMKAAYGFADVIVSRAGAIAISELCIVGKPVILIPSPNVAEDHQTKNALALVEKEAAIMVKDSEAKENLALEIVALLNNKEKQTILSENIKSLAKPDATKEIVNQAKLLLNVA
jgi:UDP-N-acetylglucosamine--N-acetylmuramyl-(pentapeptide) pyrophosphoryl-undecaprenol N-acetylglucosamine transferase